MRRIVKRNQVIITSLVIMIVVAGYLNFTADKVTTTGTLADGNEALTTTSEAGTTDETANADEIADLDDDHYVDVMDPDQDDVAALNEDGLDVAGNSVDDIDDVESIGEAVLTSSAAAKSFSAAAKLNREQTRSKNQESLLEVINNSEIADNLKEEAINNLMALTSVSEKELAAETLLEAKGFNNSVVSISDESVDVVICLESLTDTQRAQIEDIVTRKAEVSADKVVITTLKSE